MQYSRFVIGIIFILKPKLSRIVRSSKPSITNEHGNRNYWQNIYAGPQIMKMIDSKNRMSIHQADLFSYFRRFDWSMLKFFSFLISLNLSGFSILVG